VARRPSALQDAGWHAIAPDLAGFSDSVPDPPGTWERHVEAIERFRRGLGIERCVLVVHDWGGLIGLRWTCEHPTRCARWSSARPGSFPTAGGTAWPRRCARPGTGEEVVAAIEPPGLREPAALGQPIAERRLSRRVLEDLRG
jgi:pimeloyl-ACP methyl ester carboxylesterase